MRASICLFVTLIGSVLVACGGSQPPASPPAAEGNAGPAATAASTAEPTTAGPAPTTEPTPTSEGPSFDDLPKDKKVEVMMAKVVPNVGKLFKEHDGKKFEKFGCPTCHGPAKQKEDPRKVLPKLTFSNGGYEKLSKAKPEVVKFMADKVVPAMATALNEKPFDPATKKGFGCPGCHTVD